MKMFIHNGLGQFTSQIEEVNKYPLFDLDEYKNVLPGQEYIKIIVEDGSADEAAAYDNIDNIQNLDDPIEPLECNICSLPFNTHLEYILHSGFHNKGKFRCNQCQFVAHKESSVRSHMEQHDHLKCTICGLDWIKTRKVAFEHSMSHIHRSELLKCPLCGKHVERGDLPMHTTKAHKGSKPGSWKCDECDKEFINRASLRRHYSTNHEECGYVTSKMCEVCGNTFINLQSLERHQRLHTGEKPFRCAECPNAYRTRIGLKVHFRKHSGEMPYVCKHCGKSIKFYSVYVYHMRMHAGDKPYTCACGKSFIVKHNMKAHQKSCAAAWEDLGEKSD
ncbi:hypothetical protein JTB14_006902 [Gonioctena quinquepunctata]|nr:hypothetical protein JTB14_006902 [Gonioctena quinquepunctata]